MTIAITAKSNGTQGALTVNGNDALVFDSTGIDSGVSLSASVASNALTVTLNPCSLRFRSSTLTSGTATLVGSSTSISITVPATSNLGMLISATNTNRLVVLVANNAGTPVLCIANIAGGIDFSETGVISPTTIGAASSSNTVIYSASAVGSNLSYRVVGTVDAVFTTGTGWSAPTQVNAVGGVALTSLSSYGKTWQSFAVPSGRNVGVTYYNTTGREITLSIVNIAANTYNILINGSAAAITPYGGYGTTVIQIPVGASYQVANGTINLWAEYR